MSVTDGYPDGRAATDGTSWLTYGSLAAIVAGLGFLVGPPGVLAGIATAVFWYALGVPYALAAGHVILVAATPERLDAFTIVLVELAFLTLPLAAVRRTPAPYVAGAALIVGALGFGAIVALTYPYGYWVTALVLLGTVTFIAYAVHRYELVRLGLVSDSDAPFNNDP